LRKGKLTVQFVKDNAKNIPEPLQRGFVQGVHVFWNTLLYEPHRKFPNG